MKPTTLAKLHCAIEQLERDGIEAPSSAQSLNDLAAAASHDIRRNARDLRRIIAERQRSPEARALVARALAHLRIIVGPTPGPCSTEKDQSK